MSKVFNVSAGRMPNILKLELANTCNLTCSHCRFFSKEIDVKDYYKSEVGMTEDSVRKIFEEIGFNKASFTLNVGNEPLASPKFKMCVTELKKYGHTGTINTNGLLLNEDMCKFLVEQKFDSVSISVDAVTKESLKRIRGITAIDKIIRNVKRLVKMRGNNAFPRIAVSFVVLPFNTKEIPEFLNFWKNIVDVIRFSGCEPNDTELTGPISEENRPDLSMLPDIEMEKIPTRTPCMQIYRDMIVKANGDVRPCCIDDDVSMGNIFTDGGIEKVWNGKKFQEWRNIHNQGKWNKISVCKSCNFWVETLKPKEKETEEFLIYSPSPYKVFYNVKKRLDNWDRVNMIDRYQPTNDQSVDKVLINI